MSRSVRRTRIFGYCVCRSEARDKAVWHRHARRSLRQLIDADPFRDLWPTDNDVSNPWTMGKDGKRYWRAAPERMMRK